MDLEKMVKVFIKMRDTRSAMKQEFEAKYNALGEDMELIQNMLLKFLQDNKLQNIKTDHGLVYKTETIKPSAADWDVFYTWIKKNDAFDALEKRITKRFIKDYMDQHDGGVPPGVTVYRGYEVGIRRN